MFEPCHSGDELSPSLEAAGCGGLLWSLTRCDFSNIRQLWGWPDSHTTNNHSQYSQTKAKALCDEAEVVAFKTVDYGHSLEHWTWLLDQDPFLRVLDVVRDPRAIYASWKTTEPFSSLVKGGEFYRLTEMCDTFVANMEMKHPRIKQVVFEELTNHPKETAWEVYLFLGLPYTSVQDRWIDRTFGATWCPEPKPWEIGFTDCHVRGTTRETTPSWMSVLTREELDSFAANPNCTRVVAAYGFPAST